MVKTVFSYKKILKNAKKYNEYVTKDEFCNICGICPHRATVLLKDGIIFAEKRCKSVQGNKCSHFIHYYEIAISDILNYAKANAPVSDCSKKEKSKIRFYYEKVFESAPDKISINEVSELLGYNRNSVIRWVNNNVISAVKIKERYFVAKDDLLSFVVSDYYMNIFDRSEKHMINDNRIKSFLYPSAI